MLARLPLLCCCMCHMTCSWAMLKRTGRCVAGAACCPTMNHHTQHHRVLCGLHPVRCFLLACTRQPGGAQVALCSIGLNVYQLGSFCAAV
jgi:hypothetical protein